MAVAVRMKKMQGKSEPLLTSPLALEAASRSEMNVRGRVGDGNSRAMF